MSKDRHEEYQRIWNKAMDEGQKAGYEAIPQPMVVQQHENMLNDASPVTEEWIVSDGVCGFAWVNIRPATHSFVRWLKKTGLLRQDAKSYYGGVDIWIGDHNQSMTRKEAHAVAMARVFTEAGIPAHPMSRLD